MLLPDLAKEIEAKLEDNSSSTRTQIDLKPNSTRLGTPLAQPVFGLCNSSSTYKQMIRSIYENSLDHLPYVENHSVTASREAPVFDVYLGPVESPQDSLDFITNALAKMQLKSCQTIPSQNYSTTCGKLPALMTFHSNTALPSQPRGKLGLEEMS